MSVKVIITRNVKPDQEAIITPLLLEMRSYAIAQPGYISGETLINYDNPEEHIVIGTWKSIEDWNRWLKSDKRAELQGKVDSLLNKATMYRVYYNG